MKHTMLNKILNALTFGLLNRIQMLEHTSTIDLVEARAFQKSFAGLASDVAVLETAIHSQGDKNEAFRKEIASLRADIIGVDEVVDSEEFKDALREEAEHQAERAVRSALRDEDLVRSKDLPDFDEYARKSDLPDFDDFVTDNDSFSDRICDIIRECNDYTDRSDVRDIIAEELDEKNYATKSDVEEEVSTAIETHEEVHHAEEEDEGQELAPDADENEGGDKLNEMMKPIVLSGKMVSVPITRPNHGETTSMALTDTELALVLCHRAMLTDGEEHSDNWLEVIYNNIDGDDERAEFFLMLVKLATEYSYRWALGLEGDAYSFSKEGRQQEATLLTIRAHGYEMAGQHLERTKDIIESLNGLADFASDRIEDKE